MLDVVSVLAGKGILDQAFIEVGPPSDLGVFSFEGEKNACSKYEGCVIPFHECLFSLIGFLLPFIDFEVGILNRLVIHAILCDIQLGVPSKFKDRFPKL